jgi:hypothetical protein
LSRRMQRNTEINGKRRMRWEICMPENDNQDDQSTTMLSNFFGF